MHKILTFIFLYLFTYSQWLGVPYIENNILQGSVLNSFTVDSLGNTVIVGMYYGTSISHFKNSKNQFKWTICMGPRKHGKSSIPKLFSL